MSAHLDVRFHALRNALYHTSRRRKLETLDRVGSFFVILFGASAATDMAIEWHHSLPKVFAVAAATIGALQLVFGYGSRARDHEFLQRRYYELLAEMEEFGEDDGKLAGWKAAIARISGDEPPNRLLPEAQAYNAAASTLGYKRDDCLCIPWWLMIVGHLFAFDGWRLERISERRERKAPTS